MTEIPEDVIDAMCLTWRHDFGLDAHEGAYGITVGMWEAERKGLRAQMRQLYQHHFLAGILAEQDRCLKAVKPHVDPISYADIAAAIRKG